MGALDPSTTECITTAFVILAPSRSSRWWLPGMDWESSRNALREFVTERGWGQSPACCLQEPLSCRDEAPRQRSWGHRNPAFKNGS